ncbi:MAG TPA: DUF1045 domain-containing protein [Acetobacteraceae bacterium]|nr:DUF1045 domain-containing protein [Acetobacteraceae bacterium]
MADKPSPSGRGWDEGSRVALYYAPDPDDPLWRAGCAWLGRDPETDAALPQPDLPDIASVTADARLYGWHCTLKPPMRLATSYAAFRSDVAALARSLRAFEMPPLAVADLSGFLAVRETRPSPELQALADACVAWVDHHRLPPNEAELARRRQNGLSPEAEALLERWGYPGVFARWRFHMTLTRRLTPEEHAIYRPATEAHLEAALAHPRRVTSLCIYTQAAPGAPFLISERVPFAGGRPCS